MLLHAVTWKAVVLSWPVPTNRNSASCSLLWKAVISVGQYYQQEFCFMQVGREGGGFSWPVPTNRNSASCRLVWKAVVSVGQYLPTGILLHAVCYGRRWFQLASIYQQEFCFMQVGMEGGGFSWPVSTNRNSASCSLVWKAVVSEAK